MSKWLLCGEPKIGEQAIVVFADENIPQLDVVVGNVHFIVQVFKCLSQLTADFPIELEVLLELFSCLEGFVNFANLLK